MSVALNWLLGLAISTTAGLAALSRRARTVTVAIAFNTLCVAALCVRLGAALVAGALALLGVGILLLAPADCEGPAGKIRIKGHLTSTLLLLAGGALLIVALASIFYVGSAPGQVALGGSQATTLVSASAAQLAATLLDDYGLGVIGVALATLAVAVGLRGQREGR